MAYGLEIFNAAGTKTLSVTDRLYRLVGVYYYSGVHSADQTIAVTGLSSDGSWLVVPEQGAQAVQINSGSFTLKITLGYALTGVADSGYVYVFRM